MSFLNLTCLVVFVFSTPAPIPMLHMGWGLRLIFTTSFRAHPPLLEHSDSTRMKSRMGGECYQDPAVCSDSSFQKKPLSCAVLPKRGACQSSGRGSAVADGVSPARPEHSPAVGGVGHCAACGCIGEGKGRVFTSALFLTVFPFLFFLDNSVDKTKVKKIEAE